MIKRYLFKCCRVYLSPSSSNYLLKRSVPYATVCESSFRFCKRTNTTNQEAQSGSLSLVLHRRRIKSLQCDHLQRWVDLLVSLLQSLGLPHEAGVLPPNSPCATWSQRQHTSEQTVCYLPKRHSQLTGKKCDYKYREQIFFSFVIRCSRYSTVVQIKMNQASECPLFAPHRLQLNQMFLIL